MEDKNTQKILRQLEREISKEDGYFILHFGETRKFPKSFESVSVSNYALLREMYCQLYEKSLNAYVKNYFKNVDRSVLQLAKYYDKVIEFLFGNNDHLGVYPIALKNYMEKYGESVNISEFIPSVEYLFVRGFRIREIQGKIYLLNPALKPEFELERAPASSHIEPYDYMASLTKLLNVNINKPLTDIEKIASLSLEVPSEEEKKTFNVPFDHHDSLVKLYDISELDDFTLQQSKLSKEHATSIFAGSKFYAINTSFVGQEKRNYFWMLTDYAEYKMMHDLYEQEGFRFIHNVPAKYIIDPDGYLVSRMLIVPKGKPVDDLNYYPTDMHQSYPWIAQMSDENSQALKQELATFILLQFSLGNNEIDETTFQVDVDTRQITNYHHSGRSFVNKYSYPSVPNALIKLKINEDMSKMLETSEFRRIIMDIKRTNTITRDHLPFFGFENDFSISPTENFVQKSDKISVIDIPANVFGDEFGVFSRIGVEIYKNKLSIYDNWFANHLKTAGIPEYSEPFLVLCNRFALFAVLSADAKEKLA